ncbi:DNA-binding transcriptional ArsR family regulator [Mycobacterium frederiksbergense]|uniref:DNA-binding transcriptional ArsR family regulator n=1 Tax=Mycolicibacterium frederiksbergense TaxID=117567 RepID=A0ABT6L6E3_9MYCO|nr:metalloregulator ArsR/SmtB family transcription factor [Mycolicibacterium frederiksbergense]MDH6197540.1 DNA-binding transcriptional ArsR family regulator [Mycolicibacterium frederiksbergense]
MPDPTPVDSELPARLLQDTAATFGLLSAPVRLHVLWLLAGGERDVGTLADKTGQSLATVSHHLGKLKLAGLVRAQRHGKRQVYVATDPHVLDVIRVAIGEQSDPDLAPHIRHA